ncbi:unnamed protein product, partial [Allacma fusca]
LGYPMDHFHHTQPPPHQQQPHHYAYGRSSSSAGGVVSGDEFFDVVETASATSTSLHYRQVGQSSVNELDNFSTLNSLRHSTDPYFDTKLMKQKLLSINVPESCV